MIELHEIATGGGCHARRYRQVRRGLAGGRHRNRSAAMMQSQPAPDTGLSVQETLWFQRQAPDRNNSGGGAMEPNSILAKSQKGLDEIQTRANRLPQKRRSLLILVDGKSTVGGMVARFPAFGDILQTLQELVDEGYLETRLAAAPSAAAAIPAAMPAQLAFIAEVRTLSRLLYDTIGPASENVTAKLEAAGDRESFLRAWQSCLMMVEGTVGKKRGAPLQERAMSIADRFLKG
ncbi:MAG: hypothetical protein ABI831_08210 [Betaproteobacteria bacterium]